MTRLEEEKLPNRLNLKIWGKIGRYALESWPLLIVIVIMMMLTSFYDSSFVPTLNAAAIETIGNLKPSGNDLMNAVFNLRFITGVLEIKLNFIGFLFIQIGMIILRAFAIFWTFFLSHYLSMKIMTSLRRDTFKKVQELSFSYFDKTNSGWLIARMNNDTSSVGDVLGWDIVSICWAFFDIIFTLITMFSRNWEFSLIVLASVPLVIVIIPLFEMAMLKRWRTARNAYSYFVGWLAEAINGAKTIKTLSIEDQINEEADSIIEDVRVKRWKAGKLDAYFQPLLTLISNTMIAIVTAVGIYFIGGENTTEETVALIATVVLFVGFVGQIYNPLQQLSAIFSDFIATQAGAEKIGLLLDEKVAIKDRPDVIEKYGTIFEPKTENYEPLEGDIIFKNVTFDYGNGVEVIHPLNLTIEKGKSLAIVGETGSGKTTLVNLLCRFYEPTTGEILVNGKDYRNFSVGWLRSNIGYVQQNPYVFTGTIKQNIRYGRENATDEEIEQIGKLVGLDKIVEREKDGYDTFLPDSGSSLSQGEKQLISFARALIRNPKILILDEATSSIDTETESRVQNSLLTLLKGRTSISIAHRLSTIVNCDRILVMDKGSIVEDGSHKTLMEKHGLYYHLYLNQFKTLSLEDQIKTYEKDIEKKDVKL